MTELSIQSDDSLNVDGLLFTFFPWKPLCQSDCAVLDAIAEAFNYNSHEISQTAAFLGNVLFRDFPAEVFLQKPVVVERIFIMLRNLPKSDCHQHLIIIDLLYQLSLCLKNRYYYHLQSKNRTSVNAKSEKNSSRTASEDLTTSHKQIYESLSNLSESTIDGPFRGGNFDTSDFLASEISIQLSLPQFCISVMRNVSKLLKTSNPILCNAVCHLLSEVSFLCSLTIDGKEFWNNRSEVSHIFLKDIQDCFACFLDAMKYQHYSSDRRKRNVLESKLHYLMYINIAHVFYELLLKIFPQNTCCQIIHCYFKDSLSAICNLILMDPYLFSINRQLAHNLVSYIKTISIECFTINFQTIYAIDDAVNLNGEADINLFCEKLANSHLALTFAKQTTKISCIFEQLSKGVKYKDDVTKVLLLLLKSSDDSVRLEAYTRLKEFCEKNLSVEIITRSSDSTSTIFNYIEFNVISVVIVRGLTDNLVDIRCISSDIIFKLLTSEVMFDKAVWTDFIQNLSSLTSHLVGHTSSNTNLGKLLLTALSNASSGYSIFISSERIRSQFKLLFHQDNFIRSRAFNWIMNENNLSGTIEKMLENWGNIILKSIFIRRICSDKNSAELQNIVNIVQSSNLEESVRLSAYEQLAILMEDCGYHMYFIGRDMQQMVIEILKKNLNGNQHSKSYVTSSLCILRSIIFFNSSVRHTLAHDQSMLIVLVKCVYLYHESSNALFDAANSLALLCFDEALIRNDDFNFSASSAILQKFNFPFKINAVENKSDNIFWQSLQNDSFRDFVENYAYINFDRVCSSPLIKDCLHSAIKEFISKNTYLECLLTDFNNAASHYHVCNALVNLIQYLFFLNHVNESGGLYFEVLDRFFSVLPNSPDDEILLLKVFEFVLNCLRNPQTELYRNVSSKICTYIFQDENAFSGILSRLSHSTISNTSNNERDLKLYILQILCKVIIHNTVGSHDLFNVLTDSIQILDKPDFFSLSVLELTLEAISGIIINIDFNKAQLLNLYDLTNTCISLFNSFHKGRGENGLLFMGCGITRAVCNILTIISSFLSMRTHPVSWEKRFAVLHGDNYFFDWLIPVLSYRDQEVRCYGFQMTANFCANLDGAEILYNTFRQFHGGFWRFFINIIIDFAECCTVKQAVCDVIVNFLTFDLGNSDDMDSYLGPVDDFENTQDGVNVLLNLLEEIEFFSYLSNEIGHFSSSFDLYYRKRSSNHPDFITPGYLASLCQIVYNLIYLKPDYIHHKLRTSGLTFEICKLLDIPSFMKVFEDVQNVNDSFEADNIMQFAFEYLKMVVSIIKLLSVDLFTVNNSITVQDKVFLNVVINFFHFAESLSVKSALLCECVTQINLECSNSLFMFLYYSQNSEKAHDVLLGVIEKNWERFSKNICNIVSYSKVSEVLLNSISKLFVQFTALSNNAFKDRLRCLLDKIGLNSYSCGYILTKDLCSRYKNAQSKGTTNRCRWLVDMLKVLLYLSYSAKDCFQEMEMIQFSISEMKELHCHLNADACEISKNPQWHKKHEQNVFQTLTDIFQVLTNLMYDNPKAKKECLEQGLTKIILRMWDWMQLAEKAVFIQLLQLLGVYAAHCNESAISLAQSNSNFSFAKQLTGTTIVHCLQKYTRCFFNDLTFDQSSLCSCFDLLTTLVKTAECRIILWRSNFTQYFGQLRVPKANSNGRTSFSNEIVFFACWLKFIRNLSFSYDGKVMIFKIQSAVDIILEAISVKMNFSSIALLILHNMCFFPANKHKLLANPQVLPILIKYIKKDDDKSDLAISALWALMHQNQKSKIVVKQCGLPSYLSSALTKRKLIPHSSDIIGDKICLYLQHMLELLD